MRLVVVLCMLAWASSARGEPPACKGCTLDLPAEADGAVPLLVVLHGDRERAAPAAARWRRAAKQRGWAMLALQCPVDQGCKDSWWRWNGDPSWVVAQVAAASARVASTAAAPHGHAPAMSIDPSRIYLAGWSGGATYLGMHAPAWTTTFAAVVVHGGGHTPASACPALALPAYFLVGDRNPLHEIVKHLRAWFDDCHEDIVWDLVRGGDHDKEDRALDRKKALVILDWLAAHARAPAS